MFAANLVDQRHGSPLTIGYGRDGPEQSLSETLVVEDVMVVLEGRLSVYVTYPHWQEAQEDHLPTP